MEKSFCYFCKKSTHVAEYCHEFPNFKSRYSEILKCGQGKCLCPEYQPIGKDKDKAICKCGRLCTVCFQHHHVVLCPKRDPEHRSNPILVPEPWSLFSHPPLFVERFFELCNPIDQHKLQQCNRHFNNLKSVKLQFNSYYCAAFPPSSQNLVLNNYGSFINVYNIMEKALECKCYFNFESISLEYCYLSKTDLKFLANMDPHTVSFNFCRYDSGVELHDILNLFPYASEIKYCDSRISESWILDFLCAERKVALRKISVMDYKMKFDIDDLVMLYEQNENLTVIILAQKYHADIPRIEHHRFYYSVSENKYDLCLDLHYNNEKKYYTFQRYQ